MRTCSGGERLLYLVLRIRGSQVLRTWESLQILANRTWAALRPPSKARQPLAHHSPKLPAHRSRSTPLSLGEWDHREAYHFLVPRQNHFRGTQETSYVGMCVPTQAFIVTCVGQKVRTTGDESSDHCSRLDAYSFRFGATDPGDTRLLSKHNS